MAKIYDINSINKLDWGMPFQRTSAYPLDRTLLFDSIDDATKYAKGNANESDKRNLQGVSYVGQVISVVEEGEVHVFKINAQHSLDKIDNFIVKEDGFYGIHNNKEILLFEIKNDDIVLDCGEF